MFKQKSGREHALRFPSLMCFEKSGYVPTHQRRREMKTERLSTCICLLITFLAGNIASAANAIVVTSFGPGHSVGKGGIIDSDGRLITIGGYQQSSGDYDFAMTRHTSDGLLDTSLNGNGLVTTDLRGSEQPATVEIQPDGKIVLGGGCTKTKGQNSTGYLALVRYNEDGSSDSSFGDNGITTTGFGKNTYSRIRDIVLQPDGKIVAVGDTAPYQAASNIVVARYTTSGTLDSSFGSGGYVITDPGPTGDFGRGIALQGTKILVTGEVSIPGGYSDVGLIRYNSDGSLDNTFGIGGIVTTDLGASDPDQGQAILLQSDGSILVAADTYENSGYKNFALLRYLEDGTPDLTFGPDLTGYVVTDVGINDYATGIAVQTDGKILVSGYSQADPYEDAIDGPFSVVRYDSWGDLDPSFGMEGVQTVWIGGFNSWDRCFDIDLHTDGTIVLFGRSFAGIVGNFAFVQLNSDGSLAGDDVLPETVHTWLKLDSPYDLGNGEDTAHLTVRVKDEYGAAITGLDSNAFVTEFDDVSVPTTYTEVSTGIYEGEVDLTGSTEGTHAIEVFATDSRSLVGKYVVHFSILAPPVPAVNVSLTSDKSTYNTAQGETTAFLTADVTNENNDPVTGLGPTAFATLLDGANADVLFEEILPGIYEGDLDLTGLEDGTHNAKVTVTDSREISGFDTTSFETTSTSDPALHIASISYSMGGGKRGDKHVYVTIDIADGQGQPVSGVDVSIDVFLAGAFYDDYSGTTCPFGKRA